jgi:hypothetical protein
VQLSGSFWILTLKQVMFGSHQAHEDHMRTLDRIIATRGGADKLGLNGLLEKLYSWFVQLSSLLCSLLLIHTGEITSEP